MVRYLLTRLCAVAAVVCGGAVVVTHDAPPAAPATISVSTPAASRTDDAAGTVPPQAAPGQGTQQVRVTLIGGELHLTPSAVTTALRRDGDGFVGELPAIRIVDARGTNEGWEVRSRLSDVDVDGEPLPRGAFHLDPAPPRVIHGRPDGLSAGAPGKLAGNRVLLRASAGWGGGTYEGGGTIEMRSHRSVVGDTVVVSLELTVR